MGGALASGRREPPRPIGHADLPPRHLARDPLVHRTELPPPSETARRRSFDQAGRPPRPEGPPACPVRRAASPQGPRAPSPAPPHERTGEAPTVGRVPRSAARLPRARGIANPCPSCRPRTDRPERVPEGRVEGPRLRTETAPPAGEVPSGRSATSRRRRSPKLDACDRGDPCSRCRRRAVPSRSRSPSPALRAPSPEGRG